MMGFVCFIITINNNLGRSGLDQLGNTSSRTITEVKRRLTSLVLGWETTIQVLS